MQTNALSRFWYQPGHPPIPWATFNVEGQLELLFTSGAVGGDLKNWRQV